MDDLIEKLKSHIHWEEGMDDSMLSFYIKQGQRYVKSMWKRSGIPGHYVCRYFYEYRVAEKN